MRLTGITVSFLFFASMLVCAAGAAHAEKNLRGRVFDAETGHPLAVAHVRVEGRLEGTITNQDGIFELRLDTVPADIRVTFIGYASERRHIAGSSPDSLSVGLTPSPVMMEEVVATPEDPAVRIMREVIRRKKEWRKKLTTFTADGYTRVVVSNDTRIAMILESISKVYWDAKRGTKEVVISKRQTKNTDAAMNFATTRFMPNLYDDNLDILGFTIMGVTHPDALDNYRFRLTGQRVRDGRRVYDLSVTPKKKLQPLFIGTLSVLDGDYAMISVTVKPNNAIMFPPPFNNFDVSFEQQFDDFGTDVWLPCDVRTNGRIKLKLPGLSFPSMNMRQLTRISGYEINTALPDTLFRGTIRKLEVSSRVSRDSVTVGIGVREVPVDNTGETAGPSSKKTSDTRKTAGPPAKTSPDTGKTATRAKSPRATAVRDTTVITNAPAVRDTTALTSAPAVPRDIESKAGPDTTVALKKPDLNRARTDSIFAASPMMIPYSSDEERAYATLDSSYTMSDAFKPSGFLARMVDDDGKKEKKQKPRKPPTAFERAFDTLTDPFSPVAGFNRVDGGIMGLKAAKTFAKRIDIMATGAYRTESRDWSHGAGVDYRWNLHGAGTLGFDYRDGTVPRFESTVYPRLLNDAFSLAGRKDYYDYYRGMHRGARIEYSPAKSHTAFTLRYASERHSSLEKGTDYSLFDRNSVQRPNPPVIDGRLRSVTFSVKYGGDDIVPFGMGPQRSASFDVEAASPKTLGGDFSFTRYAGRLDWRFDTFFRRRLMPNTLDIRCVGGYLTGDEIPQRFGALDGALGVFSPYGVFRTLDDLPLEGSRYAAVFWEHNFRTIPFELIGLQWFADKGIGIIAHGASGRTWIDRADLARLWYTPHYQDSMRHEMGLSVSGIFGLFRADVTRRLDKDETCVGVGMGRLF